MARIYKRLTVTLPLQGSPNFRDIGGYEAADGRRVRRNILFRSGHLAHLTDSDVMTLEQLGIRTVVDFRPDFDVDLFGEDRLPADVEQLSIPIGDHENHQDFYDKIKAGDFTHLADLAAASREMIGNNATDFGALLRLIAEREKLPLVFHCIGGKDRTGVATALILSLVGVPWEKVREDYLRSNEATKGMLEEQVSRLSAGKVPVGHSTEENIAALRRFFVLEPGYIDAALEEIERIAGSFDRYVTEWLGLSAEQVAAIRDNLLVS